jgi:hypothetical protein
MQQRPWAKEGLQDTHSTELEQQLGQQLSRLLEPVMVIAAHPVVLAEI